MSERGRRGFDGRSPGKGSSVASFDADPRVGKTTLVEQTYTVQRKAAGSVPADHASTAATATTEKAASSSGTPVDSGVRSRVEGATGTRMADVTVHTGPESNAAAVALGARAYTVGQQIHFTAGAHEPESRAGQHLLAHELVHIAQQANGSAGPQSKKVSESQDAAEIEADRVADAVMSGSPAGPISQQPTQISRAPKEGAKATPAPSGRHEVTDYGEYWVVPDATVGAIADAKGEQIKEPAFATLKASWDKVQDSTGNIKVIEADRAGVAHAGFKAATITRIGRLMSKPVGRQLVTSLVTGGFDVTIRPSAAKVYGGAQAIRGGAGTLENADGSGGGGGTTIIEIDPACTDNDIKVYNAAGAEISDPVYIFLGHEMIHAQHNQLGHNRRNVAASNPAKYSNREEEETIATGAGTTENQLRAEHGLEARIGHGGVDKRP